MGNKKILIVDDEDFFVKPIKLLLEKNDFEVVVAYDGMSGLKKARSEQPDLMMVDLMLPGLDGYQVCRLIKFDNKHKNTPIIIVSAKDTEHDRKLGELSGADLYITKPVKFESLLEKIKEMVA
ncbi:MAG: response regulator [Candidatus Marinimicrobia bacterium]|nr:response regulator [Candidatus Neomarinimicrobiota bacterium]MBL7046659.1 response regulator [Candidatus Neomarinimicrobiota bacterium]